MFVGVFGGWVVGGPWGGVIACFCLLVGFGFIVASRVRDALGESEQNTELSLAKSLIVRKESKPKITWHAVHYAGISWDSVSSCYRRTPSIEMPRWGILLELANKVESGKQPVTAGTVKGQITFGFEARGSELLASPAAWIDEPLGMAQLAPGDTRWLILAVGFHYTQDWRVPLNRRTEFQKPSSFEHYDIPGLLGNKGTAKVELISVETSQVVAMFSIGWTWDVGGPLRVVSFAQISN